MTTLRGVHSRVLVVLKQPMKLNAYANKYANLKQSVTSGRQWRCVVNDIETIGRNLFECLMNRIYNVSDFERLGAITERERQAVDAWLQRTERDSNAG